jgi:hypothetical protein
MKKPDKSRVESLSGIFRKLFAFERNQVHDHHNQTSSWKPKPITTVSSQDNLPADMNTSFINLTSKGVTSTPLQNRPMAKSLVRGNQASYIPPAAQPANEDVAPAKSPPAPRRFFEPAKALPAFWTIASVLSLMVNVILILALVLLGRELFVLKALVGNQLLGGLYENFIFMDQAHIRTSINVADTIPINFTLPISQDTVVVLTENTAINGANVRMITGGVTINSPANIILPAGTNLPVHLQLDIPVTTTVPINLLVPVDIPLEQTDLHKPFIGLQQVVAPFYNLLQPQMKGPQDIPFCQPYSAFCAFYFTK